MRAEKGNTKAPGTFLNDFFFYFFLFCESENQRKTHTALNARTEQ